MPRRLIHPQSPIIQSLSYRPNLIVPLYACHVTLRNEPFDAINPVNRLLQPLQPPSLLQIALLQHRDPLLEFRPRPPFRSDHFVGLAEELRRQLLELLVRVVEARLGGLTEALLVLDFLAQRLGDGGLDGRGRGLEEVGRGGSCAGGSRATW